MTNLAPLLTALADGARLVATAETGILRRGDWTEEYVARGVVEQLEREGYIVLTADFDPEYWYSLTPKGREAAASCPREPRPPATYGEYARRSVGL